MLGRGGFAVVYRAVDTAMSREVAIKVLAQLDGPEATNVRQRFLREAAVFADLEDPHTITMFDFGESADGHLFMVFEYLQSEELGQLIKSGRGRHPRIVTHVLIQLASALREAHRKGIYHRDLKPANVLVYEYDGDPFRVKLIDFGIAKDTNPDGENLTRTGRIIGTPRYMAPEQLFGQPMGADSDLFSLGLVGFELLTGAPAAAGATNKAVMTRQVSDEPYVVPPRLAPRGLRRVLERMMAKERRARYQSAEAVLDELRAVMPEARAWIQPDEEAIETLTEEDGIETLIAEEPVDTIPDDGFAYEAPAEVETGPNWWLATAVAFVVVGLGVALYLTTRPDRAVEPPGPKQRSNIDALVGAPSSAAQPLVPPAADAGVVRLEDATAPLHTERPPGCGKPRAPGVYDERHSRGDRGWYTRIPAGYDPDAKHPVIVMFHRSWMGGARMLRDTQMSEVADTQRALLVVFDSDASLPWQGEREFEFVFDALRRVREEACVDYSRIYALGDGAGGGFIERLACVFPLSAVATTAHGMWKEHRACKPLVPTARLRIYGAIDKHVPPEGGASCVPLTGPYMSAAELREIWTTIYDCGDKALKWGNYPGGTCRTWECAFAPVVECETTGGHYWPEAEPVSLDLPGCFTNDPKPWFPHQEVIWTFFANAGRVLGPEALATQRELLDW